MATGDALLGKNFILSRFQISLVELQIIDVPAELTNLIFI